MARLSDSLTAPLRRLRWAIASWSPSRHREFHDELFRGKAYDPLSPSYPGYLTIRRFADHAERPPRGRPDGDRPRMRPRRDHVPVRIRSQK